MKSILTVQLIVLTCHIAVVGSQPRTHKDLPFTQDYSEKIFMGAGLDGTQLLKARSDRNGRILVLSDRGLFQVQWRPS